MILPLHAQPYAVHFLKQHRDLLFPLCLTCFHLLYSMLFFRTDPFPQSLYQVPCPCVADTLAAGFTDDIRCHTVGGLGNCHGDLFRKVCGDQADLFHMHRFIQQVHMGIPPVFQLCLVYSSGVAYFPINFS